MTRAYLVGLRGVEYRELVFERNLIETWVRGVCSRKAVEGSPRRDVPQR